MRPVPRSTDLTGDDVSGGEQCRDDDVDVMPRCAGLRRLRSIIREGSIAGDGEGRREPDEPDPEPETGRGDQQQISNDKVGIKSIERQ